jgi:hypothetical protein
VLLLLAQAGAFAAPAYGQAQAPQPDPIAHGYELLATGQRLAAIRHFENLMIARPGALGPAFGALAARHTRLEVDDAEQGLFEQRLDQFIKDAEARYGRSDRDEEALFYLAQGHMLRGGYRFEYDRGMWGAARDGAKAKRYSETYVARQPNHADAYLTLGLYNYYVSLAPSLFKAVGWMLFLPSGNRAEGLKQSKARRGVGRLVRSARQVAAGHVTTEHRIRAGDQAGVAGALSGQRPRGFALADPTSAAVEDRARAADVYQRIIERNKDDATIDGTSARLRATLGLAGVRQEQWRLDEAVALLTPIVESGVARPSWALPQALLRRSNYRALLNDAAATADARAILANPQMTRWHKSATSQITWIERVASEGTYSALISANRLVADKQWAEARRAYETFRARDPHNPQLRYRLAYLAFVSGEAERALTEMTAIAAGGKNVPDWMKAGALLVAARAHDLAGRREQARRTYQTIVDRYDDQGAAVSARLGLITPYARPS